jgi:hypothetical protein
MTKEWDGKERKQTIVTCGSLLSRLHGLGDTEGSKLTHSQEKRQDRRVNWKLDTGHKGKVALIYRYSRRGMYTSLLLAPLRRAAHAERDYVLESQACSRWDLSRQLFCKFCLISRSLGATCTVKRGRASAERIWQRCTFQGQVADLIDIA